MKRKRSTLALLLIITLFVSCKKSDIAYENDFDKSYRTWVNFKTSTGNSYRYTINTNSWTGTTSETVITVKDGKAVQRSFVHKVPVSKNPLELTITEQWDEDLTQLNTHTNGSATITLDEIYQKAKTEWLLKRDDAKTYFESKNSGMISSAGYVDNNCQDDCFRGITISSIQGL